jgi:hypothetical protein
MIELKFQLYLLQEIPNFHTELIAFYSKFVIWIGQLFKLY